ncbi:chemotaxis protein CheA [Tindallia californiensis]|uniref:Chemotaxis protein CheA n=1 Tax=Tindallia californiensis TaxID=159292 RepID=A0A1H3KG30_9FIRM|nr:chemotaxis protein CheA [Tindallia californiensis]SDY50775.1 two-component system, chemotaxis family, sensor kinase CheA [Tindallia californiensis]
MADRPMEPMLEMYLFENRQLLEQLEEILLTSEENAEMTKKNIDEIFRIMHTIKGSSSMMMFTGLATLAHRIEDLFFYIREQQPETLDYTSLCNLIFRAQDYICREMNMLESGKEAEEDPAKLLEEIDAYIAQLSGSESQPVSVKSKEKEEQEVQYYIRPDQTTIANPKYYQVKIHFQDDSQMENVRAFTLAHSLKEICSEVIHYPSDLFEDETASEKIVENGFFILMVSDLEEASIQEHLQEALFVNDIHLKEIKYEEYQKQGQEMKVMEESKSQVEESFVIEEQEIPSSNQEVSELQESLRNQKQSMITVNINKLDKLMDLVGEIVITESMVIKNPDLEGLELDNFQKSARQLRKLTDDLQDVVMSIRMLPIGPTFQKMKRLVRDMAQKIGKEVELVLTGEETEVDKNIIDHLSDPLMHLIRNAVDHGIEAPEERIEQGKQEKGSIRLEATTSGGDVVISIIDDGRGLDPEKLIEKAKRKNLLLKSVDEMSDEEAYQLILAPGFSTKDNVSEFSGRGVGMDVVKNNIENVGGSISIDSQKGLGTSIHLKIPMTLAIVDGMQLQTGSAKYTIPTVNIQESFRAEEKILFQDPDGNELIMIRGECYPVLRLHRYFKVKAETQVLTEGIMIMVEQDQKAICLFADRLLGEQQVVVKPLPKYLVRFPVKAKGIGGCTILGNGEISLILDIAGMINGTLQGGGDNVRSVG